jgi:microcompartment protein CcmK/EutM
MILGRVAGTVVATRKDERLEGFKLLVVQAVEPDGRPKDSYVVAVDTVGAGVGDLVLVVSGSSARMASGCADRPVDAAVAGIVDEVDLPPSGRR